MLAKTKLDAIEILIFKFLIDLIVTISRDEFVLVNKALRKFNDAKEEIINQKTSEEYTISMWLI